MSVAVSDAEISKLRERLQDEFEAGGSAASVLRDVYLQCADFGLFDSLFIQEHVEAGTPPQRCFQWFRKPLISFLAEMFPQQRSALLWEVVYSRSDESLNELLDCPHGWNYLSGRVGENALYVCLCRHPHLLHRLSVRAKANPFRALTESIAYASPANVDAVNDMIVKRDQDKYVTAGTLRSLDAALVNQIDHAVKDNLRRDMWTLENVDFPATSDVQVQWGWDWLREQSHNAEFYRRYSWLPSFRNRAKVRVSIQVIPFAKDVVLHEEVLCAISKCTSMDMLGTTTVRAVMEAVWVEVELIYYLLLFINMSFLALLGIATTYYREEKEVPMLLLCVLFVVAVVRAFAALCSLAHRGFVTVYSEPNWEPSRYFIAAWSIASLVFIQAGNTSAAAKVTVALGCAFHWLFLLYDLRCLRSIGPRLLPIVLSVRDTVVFFLVVIMAVAASTHAFYVVGTRDAPVSPFWAALITMYRLGGLGDFDMDELAGQDVIMVPSNESAGHLEPKDPEPNPDSFWTVQVTFFVVTILITVVLMNLFIGVLSQNFELRAEHQLQLFLQARAKLASQIVYARGDLQDLVYTCCRWCRCCTIKQRRVRDYDGGVQSSEWLVLVVRDVPGDDGAILGMRCAIQSKLSTAERNLNEKLIEVETKLSQKVASNTKALSAISGSVDKILERL
eukprot:TRINITY_DN4755_c0_g1_i1.p1 TRINITY_DN4755_c0_g1~~TRINITY_DN4755_c0_g1_i1.p1  ORF type:complete len:675 (+),score=86.74 TRINITY_DN4755_c0_g1_i1:123-2147(+)